MLDLDESLVNTEMVELRALTGRDASGVASGVQHELKALIQRHLDETGSVVAEQLLDNWEQSLERFTEIMPVNYRLVLEARAAAESEGLSDEDTTTRMMEVAARG